MGGVAGMIRRKLAVLALLAAWSTSALAEPPGLGERLAIASYNVQFVTPELPVVGQLLREFPGHKPNVAARAGRSARRSPVSI